MGLQKRIAAGAADPISNREREQLEEIRQIGIRRFGLDLGAEVDFTEERILLKKGAFDNSQFEDLVESLGVDTLYEKYTDFHNDIWGQLTGRTRDDEAWRRSASSLLKRIEGRRHVLKKWIKRSNREESATVEANSRRWGEFSYRLTTELIKYAPVEVLERMSGPSEEISLLDWHDRRTRNNLGKGAAR